MAQVGNSKLKKIIEEKHQLIREYDSTDMTENEYNKRMNDIDERIKIFQSETMKEQKKDEKEEISKIPEIKIEEKKRGRPLRDDNKSAAIEHVLQQDNITNWDEMADEVIGLLPNEKFDRKKLIEYGKFLMRKVREGKRPRWKGYIWDKDTFTLSKKEGG